MVAGVRWLWLILAASAPVWGDTNLFTGGNWLIDGVPSNSVPVLTVGRGAFSELKFYHSVDGTNYVQAFSITAAGAFQPALTGGAFQLGSYWDCLQGFIGPMTVTSLKWARHPVKKGHLLLTGTLGNGSSLRGDKLALDFFPPATNAVRVDVSCQLTATRDFCVERSRLGTTDVFRVVSMISSDSAVARYVRIVEKICVPFGFFTSCYVNYKSVCAPLTNPATALFPNPHPLGKRELQVGHLKVAFQEPKAGQLKPQGQVVDETAEVWGNWQKIKDHYRKRQRVLRLRCSLAAELADVPECEETVTPVTQ